MKNFFLSKDPKILIYFLIFFIIPFLLISMIWFPFGFALSGLIEEWDVLSLFIKHDVFYIITTSSPIHEHALRPLEILPHAIAYFLDPNSFNYWHVILILGLYIKSSSATYLGFRATNSLFFGFVTGVLILLYPADTMQLSFRALHINFSLGLMLLASSFFIFSFDKKKFNSYFISILSSGIFFISVCMYEASLFLCFLPFFIIYINVGYKKFLDIIINNKIKIFFWIISIFCYLIYVFYIYKKISTYQQAIIERSGIILTIIKSIPNLFSIGYLRTIIGGWTDSFSILIRDYLLK
jgi:hypothetical protein